MYKPSEYCQIDHSDHLSSTVDQRCGIHRCRFNHGHYKLRVEMEIKDHFKQTCPLPEPNQKWISQEVDWKVSNPPVEKF